MTLDVVPDIFHAKTHREFDEMVNKTCANLLQLGETLDTLSQTVLLLVVIIDSSGGHLNSYYSTTTAAVELITTHPELSDMLNTAWKDQSYRDVRNLAILQIPSEESYMQINGLTPTMKQSLARSYNTKYRGGALDAFVEYLENNQRKFEQTEQRKYYGKFCSIVQSSGTGKTRLMLELSKKDVLVLYMNLRPVEDNTGFPDRDPIPARLLTDDYTTAEAYGTRCYAFFTAIFRALHDSLSRELQKDTGDEQSAVQKWNKDMSKPCSAERLEFFKQVKTIVDEIEPVIQTRDKPSLRLSGRNMMITACEEMINAFPKLFRRKNEEDNTPKLVIAMDEGHTLDEVKNFHAATILCQTISAYSQDVKASIWVVFGSTKSKVAHFAPPQANFDSARVSVKSRLVFPPFSQLGWDQLACRLKDIPATDVAKLSHIIGFGRPLWKSLKPVYECEDVDPIREIQNLARQKLCGGSMYDPGTTRPSLAVLSQRFALDICFGHREAIEHMESLVASHLRVCITATEDCRWSFTTYPSEPYLSCIAANVLHGNSEMRDETLKVLMKKVNDGTIDMGQSGELASRMLWLLAKDLLVRTHHYFGKFLDERKGKDWDGELIDCQEVSVRDFFMFLFGSDFWTRAGQSATTAFDNAYVNFSHWVSMDSNIRTNGLDQLDGSLRHWHRTSAVQCCHNQPSIDKVIPIYFKSPGLAAGDEDHVSQIFIFDNARVQTGPADTLDKILRTDDSIAGENHQSPLPYVAILADMGLTQSGLHRIEFPKPSSTQPVYEQCLRIHAHGMNSDTYGFLGSSGLDVLSKTLQFLVKRQQVPANSQQSVEDRVEFGNSSTEEHMVWEKGSVEVKSSFATEWQGGNVGARRIRTT
ncbi:hypothetical protein BU15DRAFT_74474 [Melanogaster broomeanus]|nr:hypothetical protein BU15DRAFT_74474 [Melanogaster broomeanus]